MKHINIIKSSRKCLNLLSVAILLTACSSQHDLHYYRTHPRVLQETLNRCPNPESKPSCDDLSQVAQEINQLVLELQRNAQQFGSQIMALQTEVAKAQAQLKTDTDSAKNKDSLETNIKALQEKLAMRLAVVEWLESPER